MAEPIEPTSPLDDEDSSTTAEFSSSGRPFQIQDVDEARKYVCDVHGKVLLEPTDRVPFHWDVKRHAVGPIYIAASWFRGGARFRTQDPNDRYFLFFSRKNRGQLHVDDDAPIIPGRAAAIRSPSMRGDLRVESDYQPMTIAIGIVDIKNVFFALTQQELRSALRFEPGLPTVSGAGACIQRMVQFIFGELDHDYNSLSDPLVGQRYGEALILSLLKGVPHDQMALLTSRISVASPTYVRRAAEYLSAHAADPVKLADLASEVGTSLRSLQMGFKARHGISLKKFHLQRRLELARNRLLYASPGSGVTEIALACGFAHTGRFSRYYWERFHETPSETLRSTSRRKR